MATLAARVSEKEETLRTAYTKMEAMARHQERLSERGRILRNMHDGVGAHITSAMRQLLSGGGRDTPAPFTWHQVTLPPCWPTCVTAWVRVSVPWESSCSGM